VGDRCPLCEKEKIDNLAREYAKDENQSKTNTNLNEAISKKNDREITEDDLTKLVEKFNVR
jgi:hypothetical protein